MIIMFAVVPIVLILYSCVRISSMCDLNWEQISAGHRNTRKEERQDEEQIRSDWH